MWQKLDKKLNLDEEIPYILNNIYKLENITKIQNILINELIKIKNIIVKSGKGSRKTLSYIIPLMQ